MDTGPSGGTGAAEVGLGGGLRCLSSAHQHPRLPSLWQEGVMLLLVCTTPSQIQMRAAGSSLPLCPGRSAQCAMGTRGDPEGEAGRDGPTASLVGHLPGAEAGTCRVVLRPEVPSGLDGGGATAGARSGVRLRVTSAHPQLVNI